MSEVKKEKCQDCQEEFATGFCAGCNKLLGKRCMKFVHQTPTCDLCEKDHQIAKEANLCLPCLGKKPEKSEPRIEFLWL